MRNIYGIVEGSPQKLIRYFSTSLKSKLVIHGDNMYFPPGVFIMMNSANTDVLFLVSKSSRSVSRKQSVA